MNTSVTTRDDRYFMILRNAYADPHTCMHSQVSVSICVPSETAPAGTMEPLINTPFHMSNFMTEMFLRTARHAVCLCAVHLFAAVWKLNIKALR